MNHLRPDFQSHTDIRCTSDGGKASRIIKQRFGGTELQGDFLPYQKGAMRPIPELGQYRAPIRNVYLCGSGSHSGPGVSFMPGRNAAQVIFGDRGLDFKSVVAPG